MEHPQAEAPGLLAVAHDQGVKDMCTGKRRWARYSLGVRIDVATDPTNPFTKWSVTTHNVSGGGVGFWCDRRLEVGSKIHVMDASDEDKQWIPGEVAHCTVGIRGHLVGVRFRFPMPAEEESPLGPPQAAIDAAKDKPPREHSLRFKVAVAAGVAGAAAALLGCTTTASTAYGPLAAVLGPIGFPAAATLLGLGFGMGLGLFAARSDSRELEVFQDAIEALADGRPMDSSIPNTSTRELSGVRLSLIQLQDRLRERAEIERIQRQKLEEINQMKNNLISIVSHDLRTPMTSILLYTKMLQDDIEELSQQDQACFLEIISNECHRLSRLVDDLLEVQRLESDQIRWDLREQDLSETIRDCASVFEAMANHKGIKLSVDCADKLPVVKADADKISQVVSNLLSNAIKYTPADGEVTLGAEVRANRLILRVVDNGPGISRDQWDAIFDRFNQIRDPEVSDIVGVGLGLYIVRKLVEAHNGMVWVDSELGEGATFYVALPTLAPDSPNAGPQQTSAGRVLIGDSDPALAAEVAHMLRTHEYEVATAHSGRRLLNVLAGGEFDAVVTDIMLPDLSATEILDELTRKRGSAKIVVHSLSEEGQDLADWGVDAFLQRPVSREKLVETVQEMTSAARPRRQTVLAVGGLDKVREVRRQMGLGGHSTWIAGSLEEGADILRHNAPTVVLVVRELLSPGWTEMHALKLLARTDQHIVVLCPSVDARAKELADKHGVRALAHHFGADNILESLTRKNKSEGVHA
jgi:signal transduction histidine kinase/CheY-like chemotaxis protein